MPLYHFIFHSYRSWNADNPRGYVKRGEPGTMRPSAGLAYFWDRLANDEPVIFDEAERWFLIAAAKDAVAHRGWEIYGMCVIENHMHMVVGWRDDKLHPDLVQAKLKRGIGFLLARRNGTKGKPYLSRGGSPERVWGMRHLRYLLEEYFPNHHGAFWKRAGIDFRPVGRRVW